MSKKYNIRLIISMIPVIVLFSCNFMQSSKEKFPTFMGYVESTQLNVTTRIPGKILEIYVDEGDTLKEGQVVAQLDTKELKANIKALKAKLENVSKNRDRILNLFKAGAVTKQKLDEIETGYAMLLDKIEALNTRLEDMTIKAPVDGVVSVKVLEKGQIMPPGMPIVIETNPSETWARFAVPETYLNQIKLGQTFELTSNIKNLSVKGKVISISPIADFAVHTPTTLSDERDVRTFDIKMKILSDKFNCKPGMSLYLRLKSVNSKTKS